MATILPLRGIRHLSLTAKVVTFTGEVRAVTGEMDTSKLIYEAHESMALKQMRLIAEEAAEKWDGNVGTYSFKAMG